MASIHNGASVYSVAFDLRSSTLSVTDDLSSLTLAPALSTAWLIFSCSSILEVMPVATRTPGQYVSGWCEWVRREQGGSVRCGSRRAGVRTVVLVEVARGGRGGVGGGLQLHGGKERRVLRDAARGGGGGAAGRDEGGNWLLAHLREWAGEGVSGKGRARATLSHGVGTAAGEAGACTPSAEGHTGRSARAFCHTPSRRSRRRTQRRCRTGRRWWRRRQGRQPGSDRSAARGRNTHPRCRQPRRHR